MHNSVENGNWDLVVNGALGSNARGFVCFWLFIICSRRISVTPEGSLSDKKNEPCHTIIIIIINLFMIIMAPIFPKRPPIGVLFDFLSWG